jgi:hypothetical protein
MSEKAELWLKEAGAVFTWQNVGGGKGLSGGQHQAGWATILKPLSQINMAEFMPFQTSLWQMGAFTSAMVVLILP